MSINFNSLVTPKNKSVIPFLYQFEFCTCNHLLPFSVTMSSLPHLFPLMTSLWAPKRCNSEGARSGLCVVWGRRVCPNFGFLCFQTCVLWVVMLKEDFSTILVRSNSPEMLLRVFESLNVQVWVIGLSMWHNAYWSHPYASEKTVFMTFPAEGISLDFFFREVGWCHSIAFLCAVRSYGPCFILTDDPLWKAFTINHAMGKHIWTVQTVV